MREHDVDLDLTTGKRPAQKESENTLSPVVSRAVESGRVDALGAGDVLDLQRAIGNAGVTSLMAQRQEDEDSPVKDVLATTGSPLDTDTRNAMESKFGRDFGDVQVHTDAAAGASARSVQAKAYTVGNHVVFGDGGYYPGNPDSDRTLAHELTHVVQQRSGPVDGTPAAGGISLSHPSDRFEQEAEHTADAVMSSPGPAVAVPASTSGADAGAVQRQEAPAEEAEEEPVQTLALQREGDEEEELPA